MGQRKRKAARIEPRGDGMYPRTGIMEQEQRYTLGLGPSHKMLCVCFLVSYRRRWPSHSWKAPLVLCAETKAGRREEEGGKGRRKKRRKKNEWLEDTNTVGL